MFQAEQLSTELRGSVQSRMFRGYTLLLAVPASSACGRAESPMGVEIRSCFVISP
jgi:hypothetical protein